MYYTIRCTCLALFFHCPWIQADKIDHDPLFSTPVGKMTPYFPLVDKIKRRAKDFLRPSILSTCTFKILRACNFIRTKAASAYVNFFSIAVYDCSYSLDIWFPSSFSTNMRVTHVHTGCCGFATYFAKVCHLFSTSKVLN